MAHQLSTLLTFVTGIFDAMPLVNTIAFKDDDVLDVEKENIYPLVSINILTSPKPDQSFRAYRLQFDILNQRDDSKTPTPSKLMMDTNYIDNIGICDSIANNFIMEVLKSHNEFDVNIEEESISDFVHIRKDERNCLDGVRFECTFITHQNGV